MTSHFSAAELAGAAEGLLAPQRSAELAAHLADCPICTRLADQVAAVSDTLAAEPPQQMPDDVAARLHQVVAAESDRRSSGEAGADAERRQAEHAKRLTLGSFGTNTPTKRHTGIPEVDGTGHRKHHHPA